MKCDEVQITWILSYDVELVLRHINETVMGQGSVVLAPCVMQVCSVCTSCLDPAPWSHLRCSPTQCAVLTQYTSCLYSDVSTQLTALLKTLSPSCPGRVLSCPPSIHSSLNSVLGLSVPCAPPSCVHPAYTP
jgi:hypothetical protein